tara:strand:+ start:87 stop:329 length:243 start_codon:yes stop_codon:yes gene_type:complete
MSQSEADDPNSQLLKDLMDVFATSKWLWTSQILEQLNLIPEYQNFMYGKGISDRKLSERLRIYGIKSKTIWNHDHTYSAE